MHRHTEKTTIQFSEKTKNMILSILTPTIPERVSQASKLQTRIADQILLLKSGEQVEHLILSDNRARSIGAKRQALLDIARGQYIAFVDDDDDIADTYVADLLAAAASGADVITFLQASSYNRELSVVDFQLGQGDHAYEPGGFTKRDAWHVNAWRREAVIGCLFLDTNYGEDRAWALQARKRAKTSYHINQVLHIYTHDAATTAAPEG